MAKLQLGVTIYLGDTEWAPERRMIVHPGRALLPGGGRDFFAQQFRSYGTAPPYSREWIVLGRRLVIGDR